jgi:drug/metabolite transporter (DMT)-like permease
MPRAIVALILMSLIWGYNWVLVKEAMRHASPFDFSATILAKSLQALSTAPPGATTLASRATFALGAADAAVVPNATNASPTPTNFRKPRLPRAPSSFLNIPFPPSW